MLDTIANALIRRAMNWPYFHLYHADGSVYMRRFWLVPERMLDLKWVPIGEPPEAWTGHYELRDDVRHLPAARLHNIQTADLDREFHDHPWSFISIVLRGGYVERRPLFPQQHAGLQWTRDADGKTVEEGYNVRRGPGSIAFRSYNDRHRIVSVEPETWTLVLQGPKRHSWGFYTRYGKVGWREFESAHNTTAIR